MKCKIIPGNSCWITIYKVICSQLLLGLSPGLSTHVKVPWCLGKQLAGTVFNGIYRLSGIYSIKSCIWQNTLILSAKHKLDFFNFISDKNRKASKYRNIT